MLIDPEAPSLRSVLVNDEPSHPAKQTSVLKLLKSMLNMFRRCLRSRELEDGEHAAPVAD